MARRWDGFTYEVGLEKIREYANAVGEGTPVHHDRGAAKDAGFRDVVAPPMFAVVYSAGAMGPAIFDQDVGMDFARMLHGSQEFVWGEPVCAGDVDHHRRRVEGPTRRRTTEAVLRVRVGVAQPGRRRGSARHLDQHRAGRLIL